MIFDHDCSNCTQAGDCSLQDLFVGASAAYEQGLVELTAFAIKQLKERDAEGDCLEVLMACIEAIGFEHGPAKHFVDAVKAATLPIDPEKLAQVIVCCAEQVRTKFIAKFKDEYIQLGAAFGAPEMQDLIAKPVDTVIPIHPVGTVH